MAGGRYHDLGKSSLWAAKLWEASSWPPLKKCKTNLAWGKSVLTFDSLIWLADLTGEGS